MGNTLHFLLLGCMVFAHLSSLPSQTTLYPGDLAVLGLASNVGGLTGNCAPGGSGQLQGRDRISFVCFKDIQSGTTIDMTDNGWERARVGHWGNTEGFLRIVRTGPTLPAGQVITIELPPTNNSYVAIHPDTAWYFVALGTNALNFNDGGDQLYFLQGGRWENGTTIGCCNGAQDARYIGGRILFAFNATQYWQSLGNDTQISALHSAVQPCFFMAPTGGITNFTSYSGPVTNANQLEWISRIGDPTNWSAYENCQAYQEPIHFLPIQMGELALDCRQCSDCQPFQDELLFTLPPSGGPFSLDLTEDKDTFSLPSVNHGASLPVGIDRTTTYRLLRITDAAGCPIYVDSALMISFHLDPSLPDCLEGADNMNVAPTRSRIYIPSAFSPNQDGINDVFSIYLDHQYQEAIQATASMLILDRWGRPVFRQQNRYITDGFSWNGQSLNGTLAETGVYAYVFILTDQDGNRDIMRGTVTLLR